ncbi:Ankyrin 23:unc44 [Fasciola gigantica]|uniref:Ankyrin 23:unc44 n=1 Tax=Fasciola gigantica TaxID=46835 RepID=A0A504YRT3_FASGI|nr:Ankyrin 23:unc44 [Fasciola gigantica]
MQPLLSDDVLGLCTSDFPDVCLNTAHTSEFHCYTANRSVARNSSYRTISLHPRTLLSMGIRLSKQRHKPRISKSQIPWLLRGAIRSNNVETLQYLFSYPNKVDPSMVIGGVCPLNLAVELGHLQMVKILIKAGADICVADAPRYPLHQASIFGRPQIADLLIRSGASVSALTERRQSCLHLLAHQSAERFVETAHVLMQHNCNPNTLDDDGLAPLHRASVEMVKALTSYENTDVNISSRDGDTPLLTVVKDRRDAVLMALLYADQPFADEDQNQHEGEQSSLSPLTTQDLAPNEAKEPPITADTTGLSHEIYPAESNPVRTSSSKSYNSVASRFTLASATSAVFRANTSTVSDNTFIRAASAASVNWHSVQRCTDNTLKTFGGQFHRTNPCPRSCVFKSSTSRAADEDTGDHAVPMGGEHDDSVLGPSRFRSRLIGLSAKQFRLQSSSHMTGSELPRYAAASSYSGSSHLFGPFRKTENCQRCHSMGNPSDVTGWWQNCDRVQRFLTKAASSVHTPRSDSTTMRQIASTTSPLGGTSPMQTCRKPRLDLDRPDKIGMLRMTALMIAAEAGNSGLSMTMALVKAGCSVAAVDKVGMTPLHHACYVGALNVVRYLLEGAAPTNPNSTTSTTHSTAPAGFGSSLKVTGSSGNFSGSPTMYGSGLTSSHGACRVIIPDLLDAQDKYGRTPIYLAACRGHTEVVNYLISLNADFHIPNKEHKSPLYISAYFGYLEIANTLLRHGAQVDQTDSHRKTPLYVATYHGRSEIVDILLDAGANVNTADKNGKTPLYVAVLHGHLALAQKLLNAGASVNRVDREGLGPLHMAVKFPKLDIPMVKLLLSYGCDPVNLASFTRWLLVHGIIPQECIHGDDELAQWLHWEECNVKSLKRLCRVAIQRALGNTDSMRIKLRRLPLPEHLLSYVSMKEL